MKFITKPVASIRKRSIPIFKKFNEDRISMHINTIPLNQASRQKSKSHAIIPAVMDSEAETGLCIHIRVNRRSNGQNITKPTNAMEKIIYMI
jgi:hypothetical protein